MDCALSPIQQRNLEKAWNAKVLDRTGLILEIFGRRAKTEKARCRSSSPISTTSAAAWCAHGPISNASAAASASWAAPARRQIETDRRMIGDRIVRLENELKKVQHDAPAAPRRPPARAVPRSWRWSATPMPASRRCSTA